MWLSPTSLCRPTAATLLDAWGAELNIKPDHLLETYDKRADVSVLVREKTVEMEAHLRRWLEDRVDVYDSSGKTPQQVREIMKRDDPPPVLWRPLLESAAREWRGTPTLLARADVLSDIIEEPPLMDPDTWSIRAPPHCPVHRTVCVQKDEAWLCTRRQCPYVVSTSEWTLRQWPRGAHYRVVHLHYGSLDLLKDGRTLSRGAALAKVRTRALALNAMLGEMQGFRPPTAYVAGRCYRSSAWKAAGPQLDCTGRLAEVFHHEDDDCTLDAAAAAVREIHAWSIDKVRSYLNAKTRAKSCALGCPWQGAAQQLHAAPPVPAAAVPAALPPHAAFTAWRAAPPVEFVVDFETVSNLDDDFYFPRMGGTP